MTKRLMFGAAALAAGAALVLTTAPAQAQAAPAPAKVSAKLFKAWQHRDKVAALKVATPAAVKTIFSYVYRAPDVFSGCKGNVCRYKHTSVNVPGGLDGIAMVVSGAKVAKVYQSRHFTTPATVAKWFYGAWIKNDRWRALEVASAAAVKTRFSVVYDPSGVPYFYQGCSPEPKGYSCAWSYEGGAMLLHVGGSKSKGYEVRSVSYIAD